MFQSYKTNRCLPAARLALLLLFMLLSIPGKAREKVKTREWQHYKHYEQTFIVPEKRYIALKEFLESYFQTYPEAFTIEIIEDFSSRQYFDDQKQDILAHEAALYAESIFEKDNRKYHVALWRKTPEGWQITVFKHNKKPDKGEDFTTQPLLKLLRAKDRPGLDSLLQPWQVNPETLQPYFETTLTQQHFLLRRNGTDWVTLVLREIKSEAPFFSYLELCISPDRKTYNSGSATQQKQLRHFTDTLAAGIKKRFPELRSDNRSPYQKISFFRKPVPKGSRKYQALLAIALLVLLLLFYYIRNR